MAEIIESANFWITILMLFLSYKVVRWEYSGHLSANNRGVVHNLLLVFAAAGFSSGWFGISRHLSPEDTHWHPFMLEWRWLMVLVTASMIVWGGAGFIRLIDGDPMTKQIRVFFISGLIAFAVGFY